MANTEQGIDVQSIMFGERSLEISFIEPTNFDPTSGVLRFLTLQVPYEVVEDEMGAVMDSMQDLIDAALVASRNPPKRFTQRGSTEED